MADSVTVASPQGRLLFNFTPIETFDLEDPLGNLISTYEKGLTYSVHEGRPPLQALVTKWMDKGKVKFGAA